MSKENSSLITQLIFAVGLLSLLVFLGKKWYDKKHETDGETDLAKNDSLTTDAAGKIVSKIKDKKTLAKTKTTIDQFISSGKMREIADLIYNSKGITNDDEDSVYTALAMINSKLELTTMADYFKKLYGTPLFTFLQSELNAEEMAKANEIVKKLK